MQRIQLEEKIGDIYEAMLGDKINRGVPVDLKSRKPLHAALMLSIEVLDAFFIMSRALHTLAEAKRQEMGWKPGDEVVK